MPIYEYEHLEEDCIHGKIFEIKQSIHDKTLLKCPYCQRAVRKRISLVGISTPKMNSEIRDLGFTKLVKRDQGVYENVTQRHGESRYMESGKPETVPHISKIIRD